MTLWYPKWCSCSFFFCCFILMLCKAEAVIKLPENVTIPAVIAFGDSIVDTGNNNNLSTVSKCNFLPYGKDLMNGVPTGRFTNGRTPIDLIAEELGIKELVPAYLDPNSQAGDLLTGLSFASGGSGYDSQTSLLVSVLSLSEQIEKFKEYIQKLKGSVGEEKANFILANSLYVLVSGSNDLANTYYTLGIRRAEYDINAYADMLVSSASDFIKELHGLGPRRIAVFGVPPVGCVPAQRTLSGGVSRVCVEDHNQAAELVNAKLSLTISYLNQVLPQSKIVYIDIYNPLLDLIQYPQNNGFDVVSRGCCGIGAIEAGYLCSKSVICSDDTKYLFWDSFHPTEKGYRLLVQPMLQKYISSFF